MDDATRELVQAWLVKAQHDLGTARKVATGPDPYLDTAIYHCQQAAEKAIKGFLVFHGQRFSKVHVIQPLLEQAIPFAPSLAAWLDTAELLTPYATAFRYPGITAEPSLAQFEQALSAAERFFDFVLSLLPAEVHP